MPMLRHKASPPHGDRANFGLETWKMKLGWSRKPGSLHGARPSWCVETLARLFQSRFLPHLNGGWNQQVTPEATGRWPITSRLLTCPNNRNCSVIARSSLKSFHRVLWSHLGANKPVSTHFDGGPFCLWNISVSLESSSLLRNWKWGYWDMLLWEVTTCCLFWVLPAEQNYHAGLP